MEKMAQLDIQECGVRLVMWDQLAIQACVD